jgi:pyridoxamine 5'-phosphate oxidase
MSGKKDLSAHRRHYEGGSIGRDNLDSDPIVQFGRWLQEAIDMDLTDATAMTLATASSDALPSARIVLLKKYDEQGFCWYTDSRSRKGQDLAANAQAALLFYWNDMSRQIRVQGIVERLSDEDAEAYFNSRPDGSRFSAAASCQSAVVDKRSDLEYEVHRLRELYPQGDVPRPASWTGYRLKPVYFEFWQGLINRLHDRLVYRPTENGWTIERVSP